MTCRWRSACARTAATTSGCAWPTFATPMPARRSRYSRPSASHTVEPAARRARRGPAAPSDVWQTWRRKSARRSSVTRARPRSRGSAGSPSSERERRALPARPRERRPLHAARRHRRATRRSARSAPAIGGDAGDADALDRVPPAAALGERRASGMDPHRAPARTSAGSRGLAASTSTVPSGPPSDGRRRPTPPRRAPCGGRRAPRPSSGAGRQRRRRPPSSAAASRSATARASPVDVDRVRREAAALVVQRDVARHGGGGVGVRLASRPTIATLARSPCATSRPP